MSIALDGGVVEVRQQLLTDLMSDLIDHGEPEKVQALRLISWPPER